MGIDCTNRNAPIQPIKSPDGLGTVVAVSQLGTGWIVAVTLKSGSQWRGSAKELIASAGKTAVCTHLNALQDAGRLPPGQLLSKANTWEQDK
jgi:hypothetical protein